MNRITIEPGKLGGKPCIRGLRISVSQVLQMLGIGMTADEILAEYPYLEREDLQACLLFASEVTRQVTELPLSA